MHGASRTDSGVHAFGQMASFKGDFGIPVERIPLAANRLLIPNRCLSIGDVRILKAEEVDNEFHPRFQALGKKYIYVIDNSCKPNIMQRNYSYYVDKPLNMKTMEKAAASLKGRQDFRCFMASGGKIPETTVRTVYSVKLSKEGERIKIEIIGDGFLYNMVRIIAGTLVDIGLGKIPPDEIINIIKSCDRRQAGHTAPPGGLYLYRVFYEKEEIDCEN